MSHPVNDGLPIRGFQSMQGELETLVQDLDAIQEDLERYFQYRLERANALQSILDVSSLN